MNTIEVVLEYPLPFSIFFFFFIYIFGKLMEYGKKFENIYGDINICFESISLCEENLSEHKKIYEDHLMLNNEIVSKLDNGVKNLENTFVENNEKILTRLNSLEILTRLNINDLKNSEENYKKVLEILKKTEERLERLEFIGEKHELKQSNIIIPLSEHIKHKNTRKYFHKVKYVTKKDFETAECELRSSDEICSNNHDRFFRVCVVFLIKNKGSENEKIFPLNQHGLNKRHDYCAGPIMYGNSWYISKIDIIDREILEDGYTYGIVNIYYTFGGVEQKLKVCGEETFVLMHC